MRVKTLRVLCVSAVNLLPYQNGLPLSDHSAALAKVQTKSLTHGHHSSYANKNPPRHLANVKEYHGRCLPRIGTGKLTVAERQADEFCELRG